MTACAIAGWLGAFSVRAQHVASTTAGQAEARAAGRRLGRPPLTADQVDALIRAFRSAPSTVRAARLAGCSIGTAWTYREKLRAAGRLPG